MEDKELALVIKKRIGTIPDELLTTLYEIINTEMKARTQTNLEAALKKIQKENPELCEPGVPIYTDTKDGLRITITDAQIKREMRCSNMTYEQANDILYKMSINKAQGKILDRFAMIPFHLVKETVWQQYLKEGNQQRINWVHAEDQRVLKMLPKEQTITNRFPKAEATKLLQKRTEIIKIIKYREFITECPEYIEKK